MTWTRDHCGSTLKGEPVVGSLVQRNIRLNREPVVTTTWKEWKQRHPETLVLSIDTGFRRDYGEGVAYKEYFASDRLMFDVPEQDDRLKNKDEVVALRTEDDQLAVSAEFLASHPVYHNRLGSRSIVILTDDSGANRVYDAGEVQFDSWDGHSAIDSNGIEWSVSEESLSRESRLLPRIPSHRVFWFGWHSQYPETRLVK